MFDDEAGSDDGGVEPVDGGVETVEVSEDDADVSLVVGSDCPGAEFDDEESTEDEESTSSAHAGPDMLVAKPTPTPSATARAPTRPMNAEYPWAPSRAVRGRGGTSTPRLEPTVT